MAPLSFAYIRRPIFFLDIFDIVNFNSRKDKTFSHLIFVYFQLLLVNIFKAIYTGLVLSSVTGVGAD